MIAVSVDVDEIDIVLAEADNASEGVAEDKIDVALIGGAFEIDKAETVFGRINARDLGDKIGLVQHIAQNGGGFVVKIRNAADNADFKARSEERR